MRDEIEHKGDSEAVGVGGRRCRGAAGATLVDDFAANAEAVGFHVHRGEAPSIQDAGLSTAIFGLADTGSVVLAAAPDEPRARSLLPFVHVTLLREDLILPGLDDLFAALGDDLPSALAIVSGPSRSADIEQKLAVGVHGPGEVHVVLMPAQTLG
jgi:L-lactate dehydrogenase complex protein LldG